ncbi:MAG TPA: TldD/PmbA family protein [Bacteriovoracaceae bacterium]|nr:TldD/PmbA family protein [Bacteriovoracaceae bacterium]
MEKLLALAKKHSDSAEVFKNSYESNSVQIENYALSEIKNKIQTGYCLRIIKDGKIGTSYTKNLLDREAMIKNALESLAGEVKADFSFPENHNPKKFNDYDPEISTISIEKVLDNSKNVVNFMKGKATGQFNMYTSYGVSKTEIRNSNGLNVSRENSYHANIPMLLFPGTYANIHEAFMTNGFNKVNTDDLSQMIGLYNRGQKEISPPAEKMSIIFAPPTLYALMWRFTEATSARNIYQKVSPVKDKIGEKIFSEKLTIIDNPHNEKNLVPCSFDDEGVPTNKLTLVENGVLKSFYNDLNYAGKLKVKPTGHGYKNAAWGGETVSLKPNPSLQHLQILPGNISLEKMISGIKRGVLLCGSLGAHSGNIINGDFSLGINPGLYIENGEIVGRIKDGMISGNIYDVMKRVSFVENKLHYSDEYAYPHICFDDIKVSK